MIAIITDIAVKNPRAFPMYASILSKLFSFLSETEKEVMIYRIQAKFLSVPHAGQLDLWLQRFTVPSGLAVNYTEPLTRAVVDPAYQLWNSDWLPLKFREAVAAGKYVDQVVLAELEPVVTSDEVELFHYDS